MELSVGAIGGTIAKKLAQAGHEIKVFSSGEQHLLEKRAAELGVKPAQRKYVSKIIKKISF